MKQLTNTEIQILSLMLPQALHAVDNNPYYFSDAWFTRKQVTDLISKLDSMDDEIRKSREDGYRYEVEIPHDSYYTGNVVHVCDSLLDAYEFIEQQNLRVYTINMIPLKDNNI